MTKITGVYIADVINSRFVNTQFSYETVLNFIHVLKLVPLS